MTHDERIAAAVERIEACIGGGPSCRAKVTAALAEFFPAPQPVSGAAELAEGIRLASKSICRFNVEHYSELVEIADALDVFADAVSALPAVDVAAIEAVADEIVTTRVVGISVFRGWTARLRAALKGKA